MKSKLHVVEVVEAEESSLALPEHVQLSLAGIAGQAKEGLLALAVSTGLAVLHESMEWEVDRIVGPKGKQDPERTAKRHGHTDGEVTLGARRVQVSRPRVRTAEDTEEIGLDSCQEFSCRDLLGQVMLERMPAGVSTRKSRRVDEPVGERVATEARSTSKSAVSRAFIAKARTALEELLGRDLSDLELAVVLIDGIDLAEVTHVVALGITTDGIKVPLSLREGSTENATVTSALLADLVDRGLRLSEAQLYVLDGAKALRKAVRDVAGPKALVEALPSSQVPQPLRAPARDREAVGDHREDRALHALSVEPPSAAAGDDRLADLKALPEPVGQPEGAHHARLDDVHLPRGARGERLGGSRKRLIERTSRASASRSTSSARPKRWMIRARGSPVTGSRSFCASAR